MTAFLIALQFLTRYPIGPRPDAPLAERDFGRSTGFFPLVGLLAGLDLMLARWLLDWVGLGARWPLAAAALLLGYWLWSVDSLHLDGLADTVDGLASRKEGPEMLAVLRDPRVGAFGAQAQALAMLAKFAWLASLPQGLFWALALPLIFSRLFASLACQARPYAGKPENLGAPFIRTSLPSDASRAVSFAFGGFLILAAPAVLWWSASPWRCLGALGVCLGACAIGWLAFQFPRHRLGGVSGDLVGFGLEVTEICAAFGLLFLLS